MLSKFVWAIFMIVCLQSSLSYPYHNKSEKYPEKCDDRRWLCGDVLNQLVENICKEPFFHCDNYENFTVPSFLKKEGMLERCCKAGCSPRVLRLFYLCGEKPVKDRTFLDILYGGLMLLASANSNSMLMGKVPNVGSRPNVGRIRIK